MYKNRGLLLILCLLTIDAFAQLNFGLVGSASNSGNNCFELTPSSPGQAGAVWYTNVIDLTNDFVIDFDANFGNRDANGSDGIALVFKTNSTAVIGSTGGGIGYGGISPSIAVEFDDVDNTVWDPTFGDIAADHIAVQRDGIANHSTGWANLAGPLQASSTSVNIEDGNYHNIRVEYVAATTTLNIYFDCALRINHASFPFSTFLGQNQAYFGFTASTGGAGHYNSHDICFNYVTNVDLVLQDTTICLGDSVAIDASTLNGATYSWSPTTGVSNASIANPTITPTATTTYTVAITDACGNVESHSMEITVVPPPTANAGIDATICANAALYQLAASATNATTTTWQTLGNGTFSNATSLNPIYTLGTNDITNGSVSLVLTADNSCTVTDTMLLTITPATTANAGADAAICAGDTYALNGSTNNSQVFIWMSLGDGTFSNVSLINPIYTPGTNDIANGTVTLMLVSGAPPCSSASDLLILTINALPILPPISHN